MDKVIKIEGMSCGHCKATVEKVLNELSGVKATVNLEEKVAHVTTDGEVTDKQLTEAITENTSFKVLGIE